MFEILNLKLEFIQVFFQKISVFGDNGSPAIDFLFKLKTKFWKFTYIVTSVWGGFVIARDVIKFKSSDKSPEDVADFRRKLFWDIISIFLILLAQIIVDLVVQEGQDLAI